MRDAGLSEAGRAAVAEIARRHDVGADAVIVLLEALERGGGLQAQFSHPELGGMGQWSRGGMIMVGDMFNSGLKARVDALCSAVADLVGDRSLYVGGRRPDMHGAAWWPEELGPPSTSGAQNDMRYAFFPETRRLAIARGDHVDIYDTGEHRIHGVSQQQGAGQDLVFTSQLGRVALHELPRVGSERAAYRPDPSASDAPTRTSHADTWGRGGSQSQSQSQSSVRHDAAHAPPPSDAFATARGGAPDRTPPRGAEPAARSSVAPDDDVFAKIERLHELQKRGILTEAEFAEKKKELLARI